MGFFSKGKNQIRPQTAYDAFAQFMRDQTEEVWCQTIRELVRDVEAILNERLKPAPNFPPMSSEKGGEYASLIAGIGIKIHQILGTKTPREIRELQRNLVENSKWAMGFGGRFLPPKEWGVNGSQIEMATKLAIRQCAERQGGPSKAIKRMSDDWNRDEEESSFSRPSSRIGKGGG